MTTVQQVFDKTMALADEMSQGINQINTSDTETYKFRTPSILTVVQLPLINEIDVIPLTSMSDNLQTTDKISLGLLPYILGLELFKEENEKLYLYFSNMVDLLRRYAFARTKAVETTITDVMFGTEE